MSDDPRKDDTSPEELVPEDDAVIGRALRRSLLVLAAVAVVVVATVLLRREPSVEERVVEKQVGAIPDLVPETAAMPVVRFTFAAVALEKLPT